jgi:hypothetical protein
MTERSEGSEHNEAGKLDSQRPATWSSEDLNKAAWVNKRRQKIAGEIARNRRGEYTVPTWVLAAILVAVLAGWALLVIFAS